MKFTRYIHALGSLYVLQAVGQTKIKVVSCIRKFSNTHTHTPEQQLFVRVVHLQQTPTSQIYVPLPFEEH